MKFDTKSLIPYVVVIIPLVFLISIYTLLNKVYVKKMSNYFKQAKEERLNEYVRTQKLQGDEYLSKIFKLCKEQNDLLEENLQNELKLKVDGAYEISQKIYKKYRAKKSKKEIRFLIINLLKEISFNNENGYIFMSDFDANPILNNSHLGTQNILNYKDADHRSIVLEEIQKVRRHSEGYIKSKNFINDQEEIIYVKNLNIYNWYIGSSIFVPTQKEKLASNVLDSVTNIVNTKSNFIEILDKNRIVYSKNRFKILDLNITKDWTISKDKSYYYYVKDCKAFDWRVVYGFKMSSIYRELDNRYKKSLEQLEKEVQEIKKLFGIIVLIVFILSLLLSLKIDKIFKESQ